MNVLKVEFLVKSDLLYQQGLEITNIVLVSVATGVND